MKTYGEKIIELQRAKEAGEVVVTTEEGGLVVAHPKGHDNILISYNHPAEMVTVEEYEPGTFNVLVSTRPSDPIQYAKKLCEKYAVNVKK